MFFTFVGELHEIVSRNCCYFFRDSWLQLDGVSEGLRSWDGIPLSYAIISDGLFLSRFGRAIHQKMNAAYLLDFEFVVQFYSSFMIILFRDHLAYDFFFYCVEWLLGHPEFSPVPKSQIPL